jgi:hypothetical protein
MKEPFVVGNQGMLLASGQARPDLGEREWITLYPLEHGEEVARFGLARLRGGKPFVLQCPAEHQDPALGPVSAISHDVIRIPVHQALQ